MRRGADAMTIALLAAVAATMPRGIVGYRGRPADTEPAPPSPVDLDREARVTARILERRREKMLRRAKRRPS